MSIFKIREKNLVELKHTTFANEKVGEAADLQKYIANSIQIIDPNLFVITTEFSNWTDSKRRIDILCIDKAANLVVIELKRTEDGGHMELQSIRYAAMVAATKYQDIVSIHKKYLDKKNEPSEEAENRILEFLEWSEPREQDFGNDVRIVLISADFSVEITTTVLWLNERDLDIRCVRIRPQKDGDNLYFDIQQIIPLPEAADFQVKQREKATEVRKANREDSQRDSSKFNIKIGNEKRIKLSKRAAIFFVLDKAVNSNHITPEDLMPYTKGPSKWIRINKECATKSEFDLECLKVNKKYDDSRWFNNSDQLFRLNGKTYAYTNQQLGDIKGLIEKIFNQFPSINGEIEDYSDN